MADAAPDPLRRPPVTGAAHGDGVVLVVGAGPSGGVLARRLTEAGVRVVCLEQGDWPDPDAYPGASPEAELLASRRWSSVPSLRNAPADYPVDVSASDMGIVNFNGVGGGTVLFNAQWPRLRPDDLRVRSLEGDADDWPITYEELRPFYEETDRQFGVSGLGGNPAYPPGADPPLPPLPIGTLGLRVARAHHRLGWHWWPAANAILSAPWRGRRPCVQRGACGSGCNEGAKGSADVTHWRAVVAGGGTVITGARVRRIVLDGRGRAAGALWVDREGREHLQRADVVVLAANAIGTARLLLASADAARPDGVANASGLVGTRLMLHPLATVVGLFDGPADGWRAHNGALIQSMAFAGSDPSRGFRGGSTWGLGTAAGPFRAAFAPDGAGVWGSGHHAHVRSRLGRLAQWAVLCEDRPEARNRVVLDPDRADADGVPGVRLEYRLSEDSRRMLAWMGERAAESLQAAGAHTVEVASPVANGHFLGTARMGDDPSGSVVDRWCVSHDVPNLLVVDGSVFVTAGSANPTSTIAALALRAATRLLERRSDLPVPDLPRSFPVPAPPPALAATPAAAPVGPPVRRPGPDALRRLAALADQLVPAADGMPGAGALLADGALVGRVLDARPDLAEPLRRACDGGSAAGDEDPAAALGQLAGDDRAALRALRTVVVGAYYLAPEVRDRLGYDPERGEAVPPFAYPAYLDEGLLDHVL